MSNVNMLKQLSVLTGFILFLAGCAVSSNPTIADARESTDPTFECQATETSWDCRERQSAIETGVLVAETGDPEVYRSQPENVRWWQIRLRGRDATEPTIASVETPEPATPARVSLANNQRSQAQTVARTTPQVDQPRRRGFLGIRFRGNRNNDQPQVSSTPTPVSQPSPATASTTPTLADNSQPAQVQARSVASSTQSTGGFSQNPSLASANPVPLRAPQTTTPTPVLAAASPQPRTVAFAQPATPHNDVSIDGLGRDFDYAVQLGAFTDYRHSTDFMQSFSSLDLQRVKTNSRGQTYYIVIAGTFENRQMADAQSRMLLNTYGFDETYIRTVKSIRNVQIN